MKLLMVMGVGIVAAAASVIASAPTTAQAPANAPPAFAACRNV